MARLRALAACLWLAAITGSAYAVAVIKPTPAALTGESATVTVSWSGIPVLTNITLALSDIVALYIANTDTLSTSAQDPIAYVYPYMLSKTNWALGKGKYTFTIANHRTPIHVAYLRGKNYFSAAILASTTIPNNSPNIPMQVNLVVTNSPTQVRVTWSTRDTAPGRVEWGTKSGKYTSKASSTASTYIAADLCGAPANSTGWASPGMINTAVMTNLKPNTRYYYRVGSDSVGFGFSQEFSFLSAPSSNQPVRLLAWADHGAYNGDNSRPVLGTFADRIERVSGTPDPGVYLSVITAIEGILGVSPENGALVVSPPLNFEANKAQKYHAAVVNGDLAYAFGSIQRYDTWLYQIRDVAASMPLITSPGNHEADSALLPQFAFGVGEDSGGECGVPYEQRLRVPNVAPRKEWYSVDVGPIHFLQFSSEQNFSKSSEQYEFIVQDLASVDRTKTPWIIAGFHRPMYVDDPDNNPTGNAVVSKMLRSQLEQLFVEYEVDMTWTGHVHAYHRTCPIMKGTCVGNRPDGTAKGPVHIIMGHAGGAPSIVTYPQQPSWFEVDVLPNFGYCTVEATKTMLTLNVYGGQVANQTSLEQFDTITLTKPAGWKPNRQRSLQTYKATKATADPFTDYSSFYLQDLVALVPGILASLKPRALELAVACFGPQTKAYQLANGAKVPLMTAADTWEYSYAILTFLKGTWQPDLTNSTQVAMQRSLEFAYGVVVTGRQKLGTPSLGCTV